VNPKAVLRELEERVMGLRARLSGTFEEKLGAVQDILGPERFTATRLDNKAWRIRARVPSLAATLYVKVGKNQKEAIKGNVIGAVVTPITSPGASVPPAPVAATPPSPRAPARDAGARAAHGEMIGLRDARRLANAHAVK
jgi:hypothetical protein